MEGNKRSEKTYQAYAKVRDALGFNDYKVCQMTGIKTATMSCWKAGLYTPKVEKLMLISKVLNEPLETFLAVGEEVE